MIVARVPFSWLLKSKKTCHSCPFSCSLCGHKPFQINHSIPEVDAARMYLGLLIRDASLLFITSRLLRSLKTEVENEGVLMERTESVNRDVKRFCFLLINVCIELWNWGGGVSSHNDFVHIFKIPYFSWYMMSSWISDPNKAHLYSYGILAKHTSIYSTVMHGENIVTLLISFNDKKPKDMNVLSLTIQQTWSHQKWLSIWIS